jgi:hypothetical protein
MPPVYSVCCREGRQHACDYSMGGVEGAALHKHPNSALVAPDRCCRHGNHPLGGVEGAALRKHPNSALVAPDRYAGAANMETTLTIQERQRDVTN